MVQDFVHPQYESCLASGSLSPVKHLACRLSFSFWRVSETKTSCFAGVSSLSFWRDIAEGFVSSLKQHTSRCPKPGM